MKLSLKDGPRMSGWTLLAVVLIGAVYLVAPAQLSVVVYKVTLLALATVLAYLIDRSLFKRVRDRVNEKMPRDVFSAARLLARALVFVAVVLGITLGL
jgi:hypothetical protein